MKKIALHWKIMIGMGLGVLWAFLVTFLDSESLPLNQFTIDWIDPFGTIFIRALKLIAIPLVLFSIISGVSSLGDVKKLGRLGGKTLLTYLITTVLAVTMGLLLVNTIQPGKFMDDDDRIKNRIRYELWALDADNGFVLDDRSFLNNEKYAAYVEEVTEDSAYVEPNQEKVEQLKQTAASSKDQGPLQPLVDMVPENLFIALGDGKLMLQVIVFALFFGIAIISLPSDKTDKVIDLVNNVNDVFVKMVDLVMKGAPFFVFCLMAGVVAKMAGTPGEVAEIFKSLGWYALTVLIGLFLMAFVIYPLVITLLVKKMKFLDFLKNIRSAQLLAFSTSSSAATLPMTIKCVEERIGVSNKVSSFVLPIGATVNMDGTSLYQAVAVIFLAQVYMVDLDFAQQISIVLTATLASIGSAAVPSAGLVMLMIVLTSVGLNPAWIAFIFPVDRILDMCRTVVNVTGDATVSTVIGASEGELNVPEQEEGTPSSI